MSHIKYVFEERGLCPVRSALAGLLSFSFSVCCWEHQQYSVSISVYILTLLMALVVAKTISQSHTERQERVWQLAAEERQQLTSRQYSIYPCFAGSH